MWKFLRGQLKKELEFPGVIRKNNMKFLCVLVFGLVGLEIPMGLTQFCGIFRNEASFCLEFSRVAKVANLKITGAFSKKVYPKVNPLGFFLQE